MEDLQALKKTRKKKIEEHPQKDEKWNAKKDRQEEKEKPVKTEKKEKKKLTEKDADNLSN